MQTDILVVGNYCLDLIFTGLKEFPALGKEVFGQNFALLPGEAYTCAVALHRLGVRVAWATDFGNDQFSQIAIDKARIEGLDNSLFRIHKHPFRRITVAISYPDERAFLTYSDPEPMIPAALPALHKVSAKAVYVPGLYSGPFLDAGLKLLRAKRMQLVMDGNSSNRNLNTEPALREAIQSTDIFLPNASEARQLTGENDLMVALRELAHHCPTVVMKSGADGAYACQGDRIYHVPALTINPLDTTGAGDCFNAGFLAAWIEGLPLEECLQWGNTLGGLSTLGLGGTGRAITRSDVLRCIQERYGKSARTKT
jgi:sugar/nucleoside kinase (ribokinase family)